MHSQVLRFAQWCKLGFHSSGMWCCRILDGH